MSGCQGDRARDADSVQSTTAIREGRSTQTSIDPVTPSPRHPVTLSPTRGHPDAAHIPFLAETGGDLSTLRAHAERIGDALVAWADEQAADAIVEGIWSDGPYRVPVSMFAAQALFHGTTHRWQIGEALERFGVAAPDTDAWSWWEAIEESKA